MTRKSSSIECELHGIREKTREIEEARLKSRAEFENKYIVALERYTAQQQEELDLLKTQHLSLLRSIRSRERMIRRNIIDMVRDFSEPQRANAPAYERNLSKLNTSYLAAAEEILDTSQYLKWPPWGDITNPSDPDLEPAECAATEAEAVRRYPILRKLTPTPEPDYEFRKSPIIQKKPEFVNLKDTRD